MLSACRTVAGIATFRLLTLFLLIVTDVSAQYYGNYYCLPGRDVIVHLFEWKWTDIEKECGWLAVNGFCAVLVSPPNEHRIVTDPSYPWWQRYEPVSYKMGSRSGTESQFRQMVSTCNDLGVFVYVDAVFNHMTTNGTGIGSAGSYFSGDSQLYPQYFSRDFNGPTECPTSDLEIADQNDPVQVRNCRLTGHRDLKTGTSFVRDRISTYLNDLIWWGVAGFRIDSAKYMWSADVEVIVGRTISLSTIWFPANTKPYVFQQVVDVDDGNNAISASEYTSIGRVTDYRYGKYIGDVFRKNNGLQLSNLANFTGWLNSRDATVFIDNHETQRGLGPFGFDGWLTSFVEYNLHKLAVAFELAWPYGHVQLFSGYFWSRNIVSGIDQNNWIGPPSDAAGNTLDVVCFDGEWMCEHRWIQSYNMVKFHNAAIGQPVTNWWDNGGNAIAFGRGNRGFIVFNNEYFDINERLQTGLPAGDYCDVISCDNNRPPCGNSTGNCRSTITVDENGLATFNVASGEDPMIAIYY